MSGSSSNISTSAPMLGALRVQQSSYGVTLPIVYGRTRIPGNLVWYGDFKAIAHTETQNSGGKGGGGVKQSQTSYTYEAAVVMALAEGPVSAIQSVWRGKERYSGAGALSQLGLALSTGTEGQAAWGYLTSNHPAEAIGYSGTATVQGAAYQLSDNAEVHNHNFEIDGKLQFGGGVVDADASAFIPDVLTSARYGAAFPAAHIGDLSWYGSYVQALGLFVSPAMTQQREAREWIDDWCRMTNSAAVWSEGLLKIVPYGDQAASGNGADFEPDTTPQYDLTVDDFIVDRPDEDPVKVARKSPADAYNKVTVEFVDRDNQYNVAPISADDLRAIELFGERAMDVIQMHDICSAEVANTVARLILQRQLYVLNTYTFRLGWRYSRLEPMDLVTLTDGDLLDRKVVRITRVSDTGDSEDKGITFEAEDWPLGVASATAYPHERGSGFSHDYNAEPGNASDPVFFEAPVTLTTTGLEVYAAVSGIDSTWGGCRAWASLDGATYREVGVVKGGARYGHLTATLAAGPGGTAHVALDGQGGQILAGSADDAAALQTLCWVGDEEGGEFFAHTGAALTGTNAYDLSGLVRGAYGTPAPSRASGTSFVRVDAAVAKSGSLERDMVGKPIFFKFTSFNVYGGGEQSIADVQEYQYYITGFMLRLPPSDVAEVLYRTEKFGVTVYWAPIPDPDVKDYLLRFDGTDWESASGELVVGGTSYPWTVQLTGGRKVWVKARDIYGSVSENAAMAVVDIEIPGTSLLTAGIDGPEAVLNWVAVEGAFSIDFYELRYGTSWASATFIDRRYTTSHRERIGYVGTRRYWVAAVDVAGNYGLPVSVDLLITAPGAPTSRRAEVIDNNVLLYWGAPATGNLPVERYDVRKGATWAGGSVVGSNGNSTFATVFEQVSGTYTYWIAAVDSAGNIGTPASIVATVNQPPDYVLRNNYDSAFPGTKTNMFLEDGDLIGPVTARQWSQHFTDGSWTTIQDQIDDGYPLFIEPSATSGSYQETIDYGASVPATMVTITLNSTVLDGSVSVDCQLAYKLNVGDAWTDASPGMVAFITTAFRYLRVTLDFTCSAGANVIKCEGLNVKLANKLKTDAGSDTAVSTDSGGTTVTFGLSFVDIVSITATPRGTAARTAIVNFTDAPNPTTFKVLLFDMAGTRMSGDFDWVARGY